MLRCRFCMSVRLDLRRGNMVECNYTSGDTSNPNFPIETARYDLYNKIFAETDWAC